MALTRPEVGPWRPVAKGSPGGRIENARWGAVRGGARSVAESPGRVVRGGQFWNDFEGEGNMILCFYGLHVEEKRKKLFHPCDREKGLTVNMK